MRYILLLFTRLTLRISYITRNGRLRSLILGIRELKANSF